MGEPAPVVSTRVLSPRQVETRQRLTTAAVELAGERAFDDFTMRDIARRAGVSPATAYTYFGSKEHLLAEVYAEWVGLLTERLRERPPRGATPLERVSSVIRRATDGVARSPDVARAFTRAMASSDPAVAMIRPEVTSAFRDWIDMALGEDHVDDRETVSKALELTFYGGMISVHHDNMSVDELRSIVDGAARLLLGARPATTP